jgi:branched-subunit amino acid ABC-type transport system permease component
MRGDHLANIAISVLNSVALLAIVSIGLAVIFGMMRVINLAHGEFLMLGAFATLQCTRWGIDIWPAMLLAAGFVGVFGLVVERLLIQHLYGRLADTMLATWGLSLILVQAVVEIYGPATRGVPTPLGSFSIGRYSFSDYTLVMIGAAAGLLVFVLWVFTRTRYGIIARAVIQRPQMAAALGINIRLVNMLTFAFGSALAGAGGALLAPVAGVVPNMGSAYIARAFMTVVVGGPGVLTGTSAASGILGSIEYGVSYATTPFFGVGAVLIAAILILRLLPTGLSGRLTRQL